MLPDRLQFVENAEYFNRKELYGDKFGDYHDNLDRFAFFSKEILERCKREDFAPDIINCNDWQTTTIPSNSVLGFSVSGATVLTNTTLVLDFTIV